MNYRIRKYNRGWAVEVQKEKGWWLWKKIYYAPYITVAGIDDEPWYFKSKGAAERELLNKIKCQETSK